MAVAAEREAKLFDPTKLASYDARSVPISFQIRADDPRFFPILINGNKSQWECLWVLEH